jgi:hypothetical protein
MEMHTKFSTDRLVGLAASVFALILILLASPPVAAQDRVPRLNRPNVHSSEAIGLAMPSSSANSWLFPKLAQNRKVARSSLRL